MSLIETYKTLCTEFYDLDKPLPSKEALQFYLNEIKHSTQPVLEPMCGSGRFLIPLMKHGINIEGVDASLEMLNSCRDKCSKIGLNPKLYYEKLEELSLPGKYGLIFIPSGSICLITDESGIKESLKRLCKCLIPNGRLILEVISDNMQITIDDTDKREVMENDFTRITLNSSTKYDYESGIETTHYKYKKIVDDQVALKETEIIKVKHYKVNEFSDLLISSGFENIEILKPYSEENSGLILLKCYKPLK